MPTISSASVQIRRDAHNVLEGLAALNDVLFNHADVFHSESRSFANTFDRLQAGDCLRAMGNLPKATFLDIEPFTGELQKAHTETKTVSAAAQAILLHGKKMEAHRATTMHVKAQARKSVAELVTADTTAQVAAIDAEFEVKMAALKAKYGVPAAAAPKEPQKDADDAGAQAAADAGEGGKELADV